MDSAIKIIKKGVPMNALNRIGIYFILKTFAGTYGDNPIRKTGFFKDKSFFYSANKLYIL
jgi:hypothetical protein